MLKTNTLPKSLTIGEELMYLSISQEDLKAAERYKRNALRVKNDCCIYCGERKLKLIQKDFRTFKCLNCNMSF